MLSKSSTAATTKHAAVPPIPTRLDTMQTTLQSFAITPPPAFTLATFHRFPQLPGELRLRIWQFSVRAPRQIYITCDRPPFVRGTIRSVQSFRSSEPSPGTLYACRESRHEALQVYKSHFKTSKSGMTYISTRHSIWVNWELDEFRFLDSLLGYMAEGELQGIRYLALEVKDTAYFGHFNMEILKRMRELKRLDLWADKGVTISWDARVDAWITYLVRSIDDTKDIDPGWDAPEIRIFNLDTKMMVRRFEGGAAIPGWTEQQSAFDETTG